MEYEEISADVLCFDGNIWFISHIKQMLEFYVDVSRVSER